MEWKLMGINDVNDSFISTNKIEVQLVKRPARLRMIRFKITVLSKKTPKEQV